MKQKAPLLRTRALSTIRARILVVALRVQKTIENFVRIFAMRAENII